jgi:hypothetical protein
MKRILLAAAAVLLVPGTAAAELHDEREGRIAIGGSLGGGGMTVDNDAIGCPGCDYDPLGVEVDLHFGSMVSARQAMLFELQVNYTSVDDNMLFIDKLGTGAAMLTTQYWLTRPAWVKGGFGFATVSVTKEEGNIRQHGAGSMGLALMGAAGYEVVTAPHFAIDVQARLISGVGGGTNAASLGVGVNWY